jgi:hypothetical protein
VEKKNELRNFKKKGKGKAHPRTGHEVPEGEAEVQLYSFFHLGAVWRVGGQRHAPSALPPGKRHGTHCVGDWVGARHGLDGCGKSRPHTGIRSPDRPARSGSLYRLSYPATPSKL